MMAGQPQPPRLADFVQPPTAVYLRKLDRKTDWGSDETPQQERVQDVVRLVFHPDTHPYSVYLVQSDEDLHRVIIGMNGGRQSLASESYFIALQPDDLDAVGLHAVHTPAEGTTRCRYANSLHYDICASEPEIVVLCLHLFRDGRRVRYISKGSTKLLIPAAEASGCYAAVKDSAGCRVDVCA
jgi:hypothetical protein